jgi:hypothetical protein
VTLDLARPEHRDVLVEVCAMRRDDPAMADRMLDAARGAASIGMRLIPAFAAHVAISSPSDSAAIVRALLEWCGVTGVQATWSTFYGRIDVATDTKRGCAWTAVKPSDVPALILALLDCTECRGVKVNGARYGCRKSEPRIGDAWACPTCDDTGVAKTQEARDGAIAALREAGR